MVFVRSLVVTALLALMLLTPAAVPARAQATSCTAADYAAAVDRSGAVLSQASRDMQPKIQERMRRYQGLKGLSEDAFETAALEAIQDKKLEDLDAKSSELLLKIDGMGRLPAGKEPNCAELADIEKMAGELLAIVRAKSDYIVARLDAKIAEAGGAPGKTGKADGAPAAAKDDAKPAAKPPAAPDLKPSQLETPEREPAQKQAAAKPVPAPAAPAPQADKPKPNDAYVPPPAGQAPPAPAVTDGAQASGDAGGGPAVAASGEGYTIEEIQDATRGFFGTLSTGLASVIEHAFKTSGRPSAYVLGTEGGGAFLAGLRFGKGTLFMRNSPQTRPVWWHGPSIGGDFGASGTRTMVLIYHLDSEEGLFRRFTGVDGSAFLVGGVGMTVLKGGDVIMAPIRTGIGLRVGASVGYVRFTPAETWNPF